MAKTIADEITEPMVEAAMKAFALVAHDTDAETYDKLRAQENGTASPRLQNADL